MLGQEVMDELTAIPSAAPLGARVLIRKMPLLRRSAWAGAVAAAALSLGAATSAQAKPHRRARASSNSAASRASRASREAGSAPKAEATVASGTVSNTAQVSRPRWEVNGSSIAPPLLPEPPERSASAASPRASHDWLADASGNSAPTRLAAAPRGMDRSVGTPVGASGSQAAGVDTVNQDAATVTMSVSAPGVAPGGGSVTMRIEVPTSRAPSRAGEGSGARPALAGSGAGPNGNLSGARVPSVGAPTGGFAIGAPISEAEQRRREDVARQQQFQKALAVKAQKEQEMAAQALADSDRVGNRTRIAQADLTESMRDLDRFRGVLQQAFLEAGPDATGLNPFVRAAQRYAGTPYVWGGESRTGFDCSGFIIVVMRDLGYKSLPHSAAEQFNYGLPIAKSLLKPGDLVFFQNTYKPGISHVGIYLGRGRFIHAAGTGKGTIVSYLSTSPFVQKYAGARRLFKS